MIAAVLAVVATAWGTSSSSKTATSSQAQPGVVSTAHPTTSAAPGATVTVTISGVRGATNNHIAGVLYKGPETVNPDVNAFAGFAVTVDADPFSTKQVVRVGLPDWGHPPGREVPFPFVTDRAAAVQPGTYTLALWMAPQPLEPYSHWVPIFATDLAGCAATFDVHARDAIVTVTEIPRITANFPLPPCS